MRATGLVAATLLVAGCGGGGPKPDENDPWLVVSAYIEALNADDPDQVDDLVAPGADADRAIAERLDRLGGRHLDYDTMQFRGIGMAGTTSVDLTLRNWSTKETYRDSFSLSRQDARWYMVF